MRSHMTGFPFVVRKNEKRYQHGHKREDRQKKQEEKHKKMIPAFKGKRKEIKSKVCPDKTKECPEVVMKEKESDIFQNAGICSAAIIGALGYFSALMSVSADLPEGVEPGLAYNSQTITSQSTIWLVLLVASITFARESKLGSIYRGAVAVVVAVPSAFAAFIGWVAFMSQLTDWDGPAGTLGQLLGFAATFLLALWALALAGKTLLEVVNIKIEVSLIDDENKKNQQAELIETKLIETKSEETTETTTEKPEESDEQNDGVVEGSTDDAFEENEEEQSEQSE
jgi:hypothetical protein